jgi:O-antigen/teichoic acid export membrane protein
MSRLKLFIENFLIYGIGGVFGKIIHFVMLPIITRLMPSTAYFGLSDLSTTLVSFGQAIIILGMYDAMFRLFFEKNDEEFKKEICSTSLLFVLRNAVIVFAVFITFQKQLSTLFFNSMNYTVLLIVTTVSIVVGSTNGIVAAPTRMLNKRKVFLVVNILSPLVSYAISIPLIVNGAYVLALPLASAVSSLLTTVIFYTLNRKWFSKRRINKTYLKQLLAIALPVFPGFIIYWIFNSSDRLMIAKLIGTEANGIYAVGARIGMVSQLIYTAFAGGWQYFAFSTMRDEDQVELNSSVFEYLGILTFVAGMFSTVLSKTIFCILFDERYFSAYIVMPYLFFSPLLLMMYQIASNQFLVIKKTLPSLLCLIIGAITNIIINFILIPILGIEGAAIGTMAGYAFAIVCVVMLLTKRKLLKLSAKFYFCLVVFIGYALMWRFLFRDSILFGSVCSIFAILAFGFTYRKELKVFILFAKRKG